VSSGDRIRRSDEHEAWDWVSRGELQKRDLPPEEVKFQDCLLASL